MLPSVRVAGPPSRQHCPFLSHFHPLSQAPYLPSVPADLWTAPQAGAPGDWSAVQRLMARAPCAIPEVVPEGQQPCPTSGHVPCPSPGHSHRPVWLFMAVWGVASLSCGSQGSLHREHCGSWSTVAGCLKHASALCCFFCVSGFLPSSSICPH